MNFRVIGSFRPRPDHAIAASLLLLPLASAHGATIEWLNLSTYSPGSLSQTGFTSADGLSANVTFSNRTNFASGAPSGITVTLNDPLWPFDNPEVPMVAGYGTGSGPDIGFELAIAFTSAGGLPSGGSLAIADLETAGTTVTIAGRVNGATIPVNWTLANYDLVGASVPFPAWDPATSTLSAPGVTGDGGVSAFTFLTSNVALDEIRLTIVGTRGDGTAFGVTRSAVAAVPAPPALLLLVTGFAAVLNRVRRRRA